MNSRHDWRMRLQKRLEQEGYLEIAEHWVVWFKQR